jgi:hypothetical protein
MLLELFKKMLAQYLTSRLIKLRSKLMTKLDKVEQKLEERLKR